jgi:hypothetical protein
MGVQSSTIGDPDVIIYIYLYIYSPLGLEFFNNFFYLKKKDEYT